MSFTTVPTHNPGDTFPSADWNIVAGNLNAGVMRMLADTTLGASAASVDFTGIPATFAHLLFVAYVRGDAAAATINASCRFNNDSSANYIFETLSGSGAGASAAASSAQTKIVAGAAAAGSATANVFSPVWMFIPHYANGLNSKVVLAMTGYAGSPLVHLTHGYWPTLTAINRLTFFADTGNLVAGSRATLYGLPG